MYKIDRVDLINRKKECYSNMIFGSIATIYLSLAFIGGIFSFFESGVGTHSIEFRIFSIFFMFFVFIIVRYLFFSPILKLIQIKKYSHNYDYLEQKGTIYRNVMCDVKKKIEFDDGRIIYNVMVEYTGANGDVKNLKQETSYCPVFNEENPTVDILIDLENIDNYYLGFNIEETNN